jgi:hypothetical protein
LLGVALFLMAWVFEGDRLKRWIRWLFVLNGLGNISLIFAFAFEIEAMKLGVAFLSWVIGLPITAVLVGLMFKNLQRAFSDSTWFHCASRMAAWHPPSGGARFVEV